MAARPDDYHIIQVGDTFQSLARLYYQEINEWTNIRQVNPALQDVASDQPLPAGLRLALPSTQNRVARPYTTVKGDTFRLLARRFYGNENEWPRISTANSHLKHYGSDGALPVGSHIIIP